MACLFHARVHIRLQKSKDKTILSREIFMLLYMSLICLEMDQVNDHYPPIAAHKLYASDYDTIYCKYSHSNQQMRTKIIGFAKENGSHSRIYIFRQ